MSKLKTLMEGIDDNIGSIFTSQKRWPGLNEVHEAATLKISAAGLMDDASFIGQNVTRFWVMNPQIKTKPCTNGSYEARIVIMMWVFFSRLENDTQEVALQKAIREFIAAASTKTAELTTLNTGSNYMGFLGEYPEISVPIQSAVLDEGGVHGHAAQLKVVYNEEVSRT